MDEESERKILKDALEQVGPTLGLPWGRRGTRLGARWLRWDISERHVEVADGWPEVRERLIDDLRQLGRLVQTPDNEVAVVIGSGVANLNPALVTVRPESAIQAPPTRLLIRGVAGEGWIKQHAGRKAAEMVAGKIAPIG